MLFEDLLYLSNTELDPLKSLPKAPTHETKLQTWSRIADNTGDEYGYPIESTFSPQQHDNVQMLGINTEALLYIETVHYKAPSNYIRLHNSWKNHYWYAKSGELIKSIQKVSPLSEPFEITYLSRIARLNR